MTYVKTSRIDADSIPVIDITPLRDGSDPSSVSRALLEASQNLGFIYINGHNIPDSVIDNARTHAYDFFRSPQADKKRYKISAAHRGWLAQGGAKMQDDENADLKESYIWGYQDDHGNTPADHPLRGQNQWPDFVPGMKLSAVNFFNHADKVARYLLQGFALGLGLDRHFFLRSCNRPLSRASSVYYPAQPATAGPQT